MKASRYKAKTLRKIMTSVCSLVFLFAAIRFVWIGISDNNIDCFVIHIVVTLGLSFGLFHQYRWALWGTIVIFLFFAFILPVGIFNPFTAGDYLAMGIEPPSVGETLLWLLPLELFLLSAAHILDPRNIKDL